MGAVMYRLLPLLAALAASGSATPVQAQLGAAANPALWPTAHSPAALTDAATEARIGALIARMSIEQKVGQTIQADISAITPADLERYPLGSILAGGNSGPNGNERSTPTEWRNLVRSFREASLRPGEGRVPIPILFGVDAVHGHSNIPGATIFPHNIGLGAARDPDLIRRIGEATAAEVAATGIEWTFAPTLAVPQDPRWGRSYEGYSEDPAVVRSYAGAMTLGLQGKLVPGRPLGTDHIASTAKHFLADGGTLSGKDQGDTTLPERDLIRLHAQGYPPAIGAGTLTVMVSYSSWNGVKHHGNRSLLTDVLKGRMGFDGLIVGDWNGHGQIPGCTATSCAAALNSGLDLYMAPDSWKGLFDSLVADVRAGRVAMTRLDDAVRRNLRVKAKLGMLESARPDGPDLATVGAPLHLALAREAVAKSLVLLKNNGSILPIKSGARVLVAGGGADNLTKQTGGWTITWQGTGTTPADFPNGRSVYAGVADAVREVGGSATLSPDGAFTTKPDVAIVVYGEDPYAEFQGDVPTLDYQPSGATDLALLKKLRAAGIPVVSVFLSGRPMWTNPEINASDAFVAAWLPGTQGDGVADVLVAGGNGRPKRDFTGKLSFSWPNTAASPVKNPLFRLGYGLNYRGAPRSVAALSEAPGIDIAAALNVERYFAAGRTLAPWTMTISDAGGSRPIESAPLTSPAGALSVRAVDLAAQEDGRLFEWSGNGLAAVTIAGPAADLARQFNNGFALAIDWRIDRPPANKVVLSFGEKRLDLTDIVRSMPRGVVRTSVIPLHCFAGAEISKMGTPFSLATEGVLALTVARIRLEPIASMQACPRPAP
jgi:beta-glucosidase